MTTFAGEMADERNCIKLILPLKLNWEPYYYAPADVKRGDRVSVHFSGRQYVGVVSQVRVHPQTDPSRIREIDSIETSLARVSAGELRLWAFMAEYYLCTIGEVYKAAYPYGKLSEEQAAVLIARRREESAARRRAEEQDRLLRLQGRIDERLEKRKASLAKARKDSVKDRLTGEIKQLECELKAVKAKLSAPAPDTAEEEILDADPNSTETMLSPAQEKAYADIKTGLAGGKPVLLNGVTGSGKTEIYIKLAREALDRGKNVLYLSPGIALSSQLEDRLHDAFGNDLLCFHSAQTPARKRETTAKLRSGRYVVLGTRSALFLPHHDLGLIIVDEEHDSSYKQDSPAPRYQGRDTAVMLGSIHGAGVLLGSATPSMESLYNCVTGRYRMVELRERYFCAEDAELQIIDTLAERRKNGMVGNFSIKLIEEIRKTLSEGGQVAILRARRAYSPLVQCEACGDIPKCVHCNVSLSYHRISSRLICHHCGYSIPFSGSCSLCGGSLKALGAGTQKIEEEVQALFPDARVARLDADSDGRSVVKTFSDGSTDILVGTQIVTKGFDFDRLSLVAVLLADSIISQQDFRADERAVQTFEQFRGRCGRRGSRGKFVIQTSQPSHPVYTLLKGGGREIMNSMLDERRQFGYPPFTRLVNIILRDVNEGRLVKFAGEMARKLAAGLDGNVCQVVGPFAPPVDKVSDEFIRRIRIHLPKDQSLTKRKATIASLVRDFETSRSWIGHIVIDVDPL